MPKIALDANDHNSTDLRNAGLRVTLPRMAVLSVMQDAEPHHLSAEDVHRRLMDTEYDIGLTTVYRVLSQLEQAGFVTRHHFDGAQALFELDHGDAHHHIVCTETGKVAEFKDSRIEKRLHAIAKELGFELTEHQIVVRGVYTESDAPSKSKKKAQSKRAKIR